MLYLYITVRAMSPAVRKNIMESTVKIARLRDSHGGEPVLQIVQPLKFTKTFDWIDCDERDLLVQDFMQRPCHEERNNLFRVANVLQVPGDDKQIRVVTLIEPVKQEDLLELLKWKTLRLVLGEESLSECAAHIGNIKDMDPNQYADYRKAVKLPDDLDKLVHVRDFFNWVEYQYNQPK